MVLVPQICDATTLPVIAAGGIADGRGVAAAFMLGACGVQMGISGNTQVFLSKWMNQPVFTAAAVSRMTARRQF